MELLVSSLLEGPTEGHLFGPLLHLGAIIYVHYVLGQMALVADCVIICSQVSERTKHWAQNRSQGGGEGAHTSGANSMLRHR